MNFTKKQLFREEVENIILCMAEIVLENRELREQLAREESYEKKYNQLLNDVVREAEASNRELLKACLLGCFKTEGNANGNL